MKPPRLKQLGRIEEFVIYVVSGEAVRNHTDIDFTMGGNSGVYPKYVPSGEIWIDDGMNAFDRMATTLHELVECDIMINDGLDYDHAHDIASEYEKGFRRELEKTRPSTYNVGRVATAYREYLRGKPS